MCILSMSWSPPLDVLESLAGAATSSWPRCVRTPWLAVTIMTTEPVSELSSRCSPSRVPASRTPAGRSPYFGHPVVLYGFSRGAMWFHELPDSEVVATPEELAVKLPEGQGWRAVIGLQLKPKAEGLS